MIGIPFQVDASVPIILNGEPFSIKMSNDQNQYNADGTIVDS